MLRGITNIANLEYTQSKVAVIPVIGTIAGINFNGAIYQFLYKVAQ